MIEYVLRTGKPLLGTQEEINALIAQEQLQPVGTPSQSWLGVPLKVQDRSIGVMGHTCAGPIVTAISRPVLSWDLVAGAIAYDWEIRSGNTCTGPLVDSGQAGSRKSRQRAGQTRTAYLPKKGAGA